MKAYGFFDNVVTGRATIGDDSDDVRVPLS
jgi:hypothetical protein